MQQKQAGSLCWARDGRTDGQAYRPSERKISIYPSLSLANSRPSPEQQLDSDYLYIFPLRIRAKLANLARLLLLQLLYTARASIYVCSYVRTFCSFNGQLLMHAYSHFPCSGNVLRSDRQIQEREKRVETVRTSFILCLVKVDLAVEQPWDAFV